MLKDIVFLTKKICSEDLLEEISLYKQIEVYEVYRKLQEVINDVNLVVNHLQLTFFRDKNLKKLNKTTKMYLHNLSMLNPIYIQEVYGVIAYYTFVKYEYVVGFIETKTNLLHMNKLKIRKKKELTDINISKKIIFFCYICTHIIIKNKE